MIIFGDMRRCERLGRYIVEHNATVRETALRFGISKSTVHKDVRTVLYAVDRSLWEQVVRVLEQNKSERHLRGGEATRQKYKTREEKRQTQQQFDKGK